MGGKRSRTGGRLPKRFSEGALSRADRRYGAVRTVLDGAEQIIEDRGGAEHASLLLRFAARRTMHLHTLLERDELALTQGREIDRPQYIAAATTWLRYAQAIGLGRSARRVGLREYLAERETPAAPQEGQP